jgi:DNA-binding MarR family transcriptional regulator
MIDSLERSGIVTRTHSTDDRRAVTIELTAEGRGRYEARRAQHEAKRAELFSSLSEAERLHAEHLLRRLAELIEEM